MKTIQAKFQSIARGGISDEWVSIRFGAATGELSGLIRIYFGVLALIVGPSIHFE